MIKTRSNERTRDQDAAAIDGEPADGCRCAPTKRPVAVAALLIVLGCWAATPALGQDRQRVQREQNPNSTLRKLDLLQQSVKRRLKTALGVSKTSSDSDRAPTGGPDQAPRDSNARTDERVANDVDAPRGQVDARTAPPHWTPNEVTAAPQYQRQPQYQPQPQYQSQYQAQTQYEPQQPYQAPPPFRQQSPAVQNPMDAGGNSQPHAVGPAAYNQIQTPLPQPIAELATGELPPPHLQDGGGEPYPRWDGSPQPTSPYAAERHNPSRAGSQWNQPGPRYAAAAVNGNAPLARGSVLGGDQITATQHALRLIEENGDLKAKLAMMDAEIKRLKEKLAQSETLLERSNEAIESAYDEIEATRQLNRDLQTKLSDAELKYNRYLMETDRTLQSIRQELDDVLVREISAKRN
ncbi:hypothetical protein [Stieleria mannarensis]|uniref:hypothetical protein n=1 Tax=Stieleria mannarensis TaxID=2755585 RepID=UPI0016022E05|nr:hypothetical protein [Rhodopirellula sp. JC639]